MTATAPIDLPSVAKPVSRRRSAKPAIVSASTLALHLDCSPTYIGKLEAEGVIQRQADGFSSSEHLAGDGPTVFDHVCRMGLEGIVSGLIVPTAGGRRGRGSSRRNPASEAVREREKSVTKFT